MVATAISHDETPRVTVCAVINPSGLHSVYSIGQINQENNAALTAAVSELLEKHGGVPNNRIYINFFDVPRANCGWSSRTFAG